MYDLSSVLSREVLDQVWVLAIMRGRGNSPMSSYISMHPEIEAVELLGDNMLDPIPFPLSMKDIKVYVILVLQPKARQQNSTCGSQREGKDTQKRKMSGLGDCTQHEQSGCQQEGLVQSRAHVLKLLLTQPSQHSDSTVVITAINLKSCMPLRNTGSRAAGCFSGIPLGVDGRGRDGVSRPMLSG